MPSTGGDSSSVVKETTRFTDENGNIDYLSMLNEILVVAKERERRMSWESRLKKIDFSDNRAALKRGMRRKFDDNKDSLDPRLKRKRSLNVQAEEDVDFRRRLKLIDFDDGCVDKKLRTKRKLEEDPNIVDPRLLKRKK